MRSATSPRAAGREDSLAPVVMGSHLDTQVNGGRYDGIVGVMAALEVVRTLDDRGIVTRRPLEIAVWMNEEVRFSPPMVGSAAFAGVHDVDWVHARRADDGATIGDELRRIGYLGQAPVGGRALDAYFELHIEQGPELHARGVPVGVVTIHPHGFIVDVEGETAHTGPWPMDKRRNALVGIYAGGGGQRHRLEIPRQRWQGHGGASSPGPTSPASCRTTRSSRRRAPRRPATADTMPPSS